MAARKTTKAPKGASLNIPPELLAEAEKLAGRLGITLEVALVKVVEVGLKRLSHVFRRKQGDSGVVGRTEDRTEQRRKALEELDTRKAARGKKPRRRKVDELGGGGE